MRNVALRPQPIVLATKPGNLRRRYRVPRRPRIPPSASIAPVAQHRGGEAQLACDPAQRPTAAHQQGYRFPLELIRKMTPSLAHSTPFRSHRSLAKVSTNSREAHDLLVEDLPREHAGLVEDLAAVFSIGIAVEIGALVEKPLALGVDDDAERVIVLLEAVADIEIAKGRRVQIPRGGMRARPVPGDGGAEIERHFEALPRIEARAAHL